MAFKAGDKRSKGNIGEDLAAKYLQNLGYAILDRNFHSRFGEIDIVAQEGNTLVFVEVKTRWSKKFGEPAEAVTPGKLKSIIKTSQYYRLLHPNLPENERIDVVAISTDFYPPKVELFKSVTS